MTDLFGAEEPAEIEVELFCDEVKDSTNPETGHRWHYITMMAVPCHKKTALIESLLEARDGCESEIKSTDLHDYRKRRTAKRWLDLLLADTHNRIYLSILGVNVTLLNRRAFGGDRFAPIYNRFFRAGALGFCLRIGRGMNVVVRRIWHDRGEMQHDEYFPWHTLYKMERDGRVAVLCHEIDFRASDHRTETESCAESHILQFADLVGGLTKQLLDNTSNEEGRRECAGVIAPLVARLMDAPNNVNSRYRYAGKYFLSFFPQGNLTDLELLDPMARAQSGFFFKRPLLQIEKDCGQIGLFEDRREGVRNRPTAAD